MSWKNKSIFAPLPTTKRGFSVNLKGDPKGKTFLYCNGKNVIIRDIEDPGVSDIYVEHAKDVSVACYAPSGFYIASGDSTGKVRIWDTVNKEHLLKYEYNPISGNIKDIAWSPDSKRLAVGGEGRQTFATAFLWDSGSSVGSLSYHSKSVNSLDYKPTRPFRIVTGSEDRTAAFYEGPPFKYKQSIKDHENYVNVVRFSPDGELFATGGADGKLFLFDGKTAGKIAELQDGEKAHQGQVNGISWSSDSAHLFTASGDKTAKIWDVGSHSLLTTFQVGSEIDDQQLGCLWQNDHLLTVTLDGHFNFWDRNDSSKPIRVWEGHNKNITAASLSADKKTIFTGSFDALVNTWDVSSGVCKKVGGTFHKNQVSDLEILDDEVVSCGMDDVVKWGTVQDMHYTADSVGVESEPKAMAVGPNGLVVLACIKEIVVIRNKQVVYSENVTYEPQCVTINPSQTEVAFGGGDLDQKLHIYSLDNDKLKEKNVVDAKGQVSVAKYSPDGKFLAFSSNKMAIVYTTEPFEEVSKRTAHSARITCLDWESDSNRFVTGSVDSNLIVWNVENDNKRVKILRAHPASVITKVKWLSESTFLSTGMDCCVKIWEQE